MPTRQWFTVTRAEGGGARAAVALWLKATLGMIPDPEKWELVFGKDRGPSIG
jgi:hypothetical protein